MLRDLEPDNSQTVGELALSVIQFLHISMTVFAIRHILPQSAVQPRASVFSELPCFSFTDGEILVHYSMDDALAKISLYVIFAVS